jgi:hypothetical protein
MTQSRDSEGLDDRCYETPIQGGHPAAANRAAKHVPGQRTSTTTISL